MKLDNLIKETDLINENYEQLKLEQKQQTKPSEKIKPKLQNLPKIFLTGLEWKNFIMVILVILNMILYITCCSVLLKYFFIIILKNFKFKYSNFFSFGILLKFERFGKNLTQLFRQFDLFRIR